MTEETPKRGRPSSFTQEVADFVCAELATGKSLRAIYTEKQIDLPHMATLFRWLADDDSFREQYARAREMQAETLADEIVAIADDGSNDTYCDDEGNKRTDHDVIARSKLRVEARKWVAAKLLPKKYGDRLQVDNTHSFEQQSTDDLQTRAIKLAQSLGLPALNALLPADDKQQNSE